MHSQMNRKKCTVPNCVLVRYEHLRYLQTLNPQSYMTSETMWSQPDSHDPPSPSYLSRLDLVDADMVALLRPSARRFSFDDTGIDTDPLDIFASIKRGPLSAITAPVATNVHHVSFGGPTLVSGGIASRHPPHESFLHKFSLVADATRELERSPVQFRKLSFDAADAPRRTSFTSEFPNFKEMASLSSPHGSFNENLNVPSQRSARNQLISDKIDHYNSSKTLPIAAHALPAGPVEPVLKETVSAAPAEHLPSHNFWSPATATLFTPMAPTYFMPPNAMPPMFNPYARTGLPVPFIVPAGPPHAPSQYLDPSVYSMMPYETVADEKSGEENPAPTDPKDPHKGSITNIGIMNHQMPPAPFMFQPFLPYPFYQPGMVPLGPGSGGAPMPVYGSSPAPHSKPLLRPLLRGQAQANGSQRNGSSSPSTTATSTGKRKVLNRQNGGKSGQAHIQRSPLLEQVRANPKDKQYFLKDIVGHALEFTKDQHGSRFIQQQLRDASEEERQLVFDEICASGYELMTDVFGNYVIQKYFEHGLEKQKLALLACMRGNVRQLSMQMYGCRVIQRALEEVGVENQLEIVVELQDHVLECARDQNGNHVIQKLIERIPFERIQFISRSLNDEIYSLSTHPYGCRVVQRLLQYLDAATQEQILLELNRHIHYLIQDQYGNYVMQHILEQGARRDRAAILQCVVGQVVTFSKHKFASNVIEKCIKYGTLPDKQKILHEIMEGNMDTNTQLVDDDLPLALMMKDQYANYVIQKLVEGFGANSVEKRMLVGKLRQYLKQMLAKNTFGKHLASVEKMIVVAENALLDASAL